MNRQCLGTRPLILYNSIRMRTPLIPVALIALLLVAGEGFAQTRERGGAYRLTFTLAPRGLDPVRMIDYSSSFIGNQIYDLLLDYDSTMTLRPRLAKRWEVSADGLTYTYHLRTGIRFQDDRCFPNGKGRLLTAHDVKYCFDRVVDDRAGAVGTSYFAGKVHGAREYHRATSGLPNGRKPSVAGVSGFRALDDSTFTITLLKPFAPFKYYPTLSFCSIYPKEAVEHYGRDFFRNPVGTGAFRLKEWTPEERVVLERNPGYWRYDAEGRRLPYLDSMIITMNRDEKKVASDFRKGAIEEIYRPSNDVIRALIPDDAKRMNEPFTLTALPSFSLQFYGMLATRLPFSDRRVRQAFNHAIDRVKLVRYVLYGHGVPALHGIVPPGMPGYPIDSIQGYDYNPEKGRALLAEAGYPDGKDFPSIELLINNSGERNNDIAEGVVSMIEQSLGIHLKIRRVDWAQHLDLVENGKAPFFRLGWIADMPDPEMFLWILHSESIPYGNSVRYADDAFDSLHDRAVATADDAERNRLYREAERIAIDEAPLLPLFYDINYLFLKRSVRGLRTNALGLFDYSEVWLAE